MQMLKRRVSRGFRIVLVVTLASSLVLLVWAYFAEQRHIENKRNRMRALSAAKQIAFELERAVIEERDIEVTESWIANVLGDALDGKRYRVYVLNEWRDIFGHDCESFGMFVAVEVLLRGDRRTFGGLDCMHLVRAEDLARDFERFKMYSFD